jgi:hypothetical protein
MWILTPLRSRIGTPRLLIGHEQKAAPLHAAPPRIVQRKGENEAGTTSMFSCLIIMLGPPPEGGGQMPLARASSRMRKRSAASL